MDHQYGPDASIFFDASKKMLEIFGTKTVVIGTSANATKRATIVLTIMAAGNHLVPMLCTKEWRTSRHASSPTMSISTKHRTMRGWTRVMLHWVEDIPALYISLTPQGIVPIILLDSYQCHIMASVVNLIQDLGCEVVHIPGGCTGLVQPLDVSYNKPFKTRIRATWEE